MFGMLIDDAEYAPSAYKDVGPSRIRRDREDVKKLMDQLSRFPIFDSENHLSDELICLMTRDVAPENIKDALLKAQVHGESKIIEFVDTRLCKQIVKFHAKLKLSQSPTLTTMYMVANKKDISQKGQTIKSDRFLFQRLLVAKESGRDVDLKNLLSHELTNVPLSLADTAGNLRPTNKAALGKILENGVSVEVLPESSLKTCFIIDGQALVQAIGKPFGAKSFGNLADVFNATVFSHFNQQCQRIDVVFDRYRNTSIKSGARTRREGQVRSIRRKIDSRNIPFPTNWKQFIDLTDNKANLANFLSTQMMIAVRQSHPTYELITAGGFHEETTVESSQGSDVKLLQSTQEEADTRMILHTKSACKEGYERVVVSSRDNDVLVLLTYFAGQLSQEIWLRTGTRQQRCFVAVHNIKLTPCIQSNILAYHALTGCDTVSQPSGHGKKRTWQVFQQHCSLLNTLGHGKLTVLTARDAEVFFCRIYSPNTDETSINDVCYRMFQKGTKDQEKLPPTQKCLEQHIHHAHYQTQVWRLADVPQPDLDSPIENGWFEDATTGRLHPSIIVSDPLPIEFFDIVYCRCKTVQRPDVLAEQGT